MHPRIRRHPVGSALQYAALGHAPSKADLDAIAATSETPAAGAALARAVSASARRIMEAHAAGEFGDARRIAAEIAEELVQELPDYEPERPDPDAIRDSIRHIQR